MGLSPTIRIQTADQDFEIPLGDGPAQITGGIGGWEAVERADRVSLTEWSGADQIAQSVPCLLDGFAERRSVQPDLDRILALAITEERTEPPSFIATGPIHFSGIRWVLAGVEFGDAIRRRGDRVLVRQFLALQLLEHVESGGLSIQGKVGKAKKKASQRTYTVKGDKETLQKIAQAKLGSAKKAKEIGKLNGIRDVSRKLPQGKELRLPPK